MRMLRQTCIVLVVLAVSVLPLAAQSLPSLKLERDTNWWITLNASGAWYRAFGDAFPTGNTSDGNPFTPPATGDRFFRQDQNKTYSWDGAAWIQVDDWLVSNEGGVTDGDKGDIVVTAGVWGIDTGVATTAGRAIMDDVTAADQRTTLGLGTLATQSGTFSGTSSGTNTGDQTITLTGNVTGSGTGSFAATISASAVANSMLADMAQSTLKGRAAAAGTGAPTDLTAAQVLAILSAFSTSSMQVFTTPGANTYTPTSGTKYVIAISTGAGGGGGGGDASAAANGGAGAGGGAGGTTISVFAASSQTITIGTGGTAGSGTNGTGGGTGGNTTYGALDTATGGTGGAGSGNSAIRSQVTAGGAGGAPADGAANLTGGTGFTGFLLLTLDATDANENAIAQGGNGGVSFWGGGGRGGANAQDAAAADSTAGSQAGSNGAAPGSGGGGGVVLNTATGVAGGTGANGYCLVLEFQ